ncbi:LPS export ABC transporter permease LptF [Hydrogenophilus islandicus]
MKVFDRSILAEISRSALLFALALTLIIAAVSMVRLLGTVAAGDLTPDLYLPYLPWAISERLPLVITVSAFAAVLVAVQRWVRDSEWAVWRSLGVSRGRFALPLGVFGVILGLLLAALAAWLVPFAEKEKDLLKAVAHSRDESETVAPGIFRESKDGRRVLFVAPSDPDAVGLFFLRQWHEGRQTVVVAKGARTEGREDGRWVVLEEGRRYEEGESPLAFRIASFREQALWLTPPQPISEVERMRAVATPLLWQQAVAGNRAAGGEVVQRFGLPIAAVVLVFLALPLAESEPRAARGVSLLFALLLFFAYVNLISLAQAFVVRGRLPLSVGFWLPHFVFAAVTALLFAWQARRSR